MKQPDDGHLALLDDYGTALQVTRAFDELNQIICGLLGAHIKLWVEKNLGEGWDGDFDLAEAGEIWFAHQSWVDAPDKDEKEDTQHLVWFWFGIDGTSEEAETWATHLLGFAQEPFKAGVILNGLAEKIGKDEAVRRSDALAAHLKDRYTRKANKRVLKYFAPVRLDAAALSKALAEEDVDGAFSAITEQLQEFKAVVQEIDALLVALSADAERV